MTKDGQWAYRYTDGAEVIMIKMPERPASAWEYSSEHRIRCGPCWLVTQL